MNRKLFLSLVMVVSCLIAEAQDTLPNFSLRNLGNNRTQISWINPFETIVQLSVQRSFDSLRNFRTIFSPTIASSKQNGFLDTKTPAATKVFYRIYYVMAGGAYFFTPSKRAASGIEITAGNANVIQPDAEDLITIRLKDAVISQLNAEQYKRFRDSMIYQTKDTLFAVSPTEILIKPYAAKQMWKASQYIFSSREGFINIRLPLAATRHYRVIFFEEDGTQLFEIARIKEPTLIIDKANFIHSGWFLFDLYENGVLLERNKFYVARDF